MGFQQLTLLQFGGLPAALVIAPLLDVANRRAEQGWTVLLAHGQQGDFLLEPQEFLHDHQTGAAARTFGGGGPGLLQFLGVSGHALAFAGGAHHRLHHHRPAQRFSCAAQLFCRAGIAIAGCAQAQFAGGQIADAIAIHRDCRGPGGGDHGDALGFQFSQGIDGEGFNFWDH